MPVYWRIIENNGDLGRWPSRHLPANCQINQRTTLQLGGVLSKDRKRAAAVNEKIYEKKRGTHLLSSCELLRLLWSLQALTRPMELNYICKLLRSLWIFILALNIKFRKLQKIASLWNCMQMKTFNISTFQRSMME